jgi:putative serine protease PepD
VSDVPAPPDPEVDPREPQVSTTPRPSPRLIAAAIGTVAAAALLGGVIGGAIVARQVSGDDRACRDADVAQGALPSVVTVLASGAAGSGNGTGQLIREGGYVLTNYHVISAAVESGAVRVQYSDGSVSEATVVGTDPATDLAVLQATDEATDRPLITIGTSEPLQVGQPVVALGAPLGLTSTVTSGIVSALGRNITVPTGTGNAVLLDAIQTDATINPGNSGGPLVDCSGALVGINTAISTVPNAEGVGGGGSVGLGFAIPVDLAMPIAEELITSGRALHPDLGLTAQALVAQGEEVPDGLLVMTVDAGGPAARAGIREGDVIVAIDGARARTLEQLIVKKLTLDVGDTVPVTIWRAGQTSDAGIVLGEPR